MIKNLPAMQASGFNPWVGKIPWRRIWQPIPVFLPGESLGTEEPGGLQSMGSQRVRHDWVTKHGTKNNLSFFLHIYKTGKKDLWLTHFRELLNQTKYANTLYKTVKAHKHLNLLLKLWLLGEGRKDFGEGNGTPVQYSCLENPMDGGAW